jgi:uncharacterized protein YjiS (DUF1127 family)
MTIALIAALARILYRMRERRRSAIARQEIASLSERELRDIGLSHAAAWSRHQDPGRAMRAPRGGRGEREGGSLGMREPA